ncbi:MAG: indole-3-glycerol-phosphate synthase [Methanocellales archaeon]
MHKIIEEIISSARQRQAINRIKAREIEKRDLIAQLKKAKESRKIPVIAEVKPASPLGAKRSISPAQAAAIAREMESGGAIAISVLTEPEYFNGSLENLVAIRSNVSLPVLRKDFIVSEAQLFEVKVDSILLIASLLGSESRHFAELAIKLGMEPLIEVHSEKDVEVALAINAKLIGINNRDFESLTIDLRRTEKLAPLIKRQDEEVFVISESGIENAADVQRIINAGADGILVGSAIMNSGNIKAKTLELVNALRA